MGLQTCGLNRNHAQKELQPHGTVEFPCAAYASRHTDAPGDTIPWHWHEELEVIFVAAGTLKLQIPGGEYLLQEGSLVVLNSNVLHSLSGHPAGALRSMVFSPFLITGGADTVFYKNYVRALPACPDFSVWQAEPGPDVKRFSAAFSAMETDAFAYEFTVRENPSQLLLHCYAQCSRACLRRNRQKARTRCASNRCCNICRLPMPSRSRSQTLRRPPG